MSIKLVTKLLACLLEVAIGIWTYPKQVAREFLISVCDIILTTHQNVDQTMGKLENQTVSSFELPVWFSFVAETVAVVAVA